MFAKIKRSRGTNILAELAMIVIGINIALWFEGWFDDLQEAETELQYLGGLRDDLSRHEENCDRRPDARPDLRYGSAQPPKHSVMTTHSSSGSALSSKKSPRLSPTSITIS